MDNLTHSLVGWALAETGLKRRTRKGLAACILAANMPDIDVLFGWAPWAPLAMHRGFTHGLVGGVLLMPPLLAGLLWLFDQWQVKRGAHFRSRLPMRFGWLVVLSYLGAITHPLMDLQNTYAVQLLSPASEHWFHSDGLFIISPYVLAMLGAGVWLARSRARRSRPRSGRPAILALAGVFGFVALNIGISALAWRAPRLDAPYANPDRVFASPEPLAFWRREVVWRERGRMASGHFDPLRSLTSLSNLTPSAPDNMADPAAQLAARSDPVAADFLAWSQMPVARIERQGCKAKVTFGDARYASPAMSRSFLVTSEVALPCPPPAPR
jgi:inner membrane protein